MKSKLFLESGEEVALINVVVPVYKVEQYLDRCITSILAQTMRDFTLILVDDGSPDNCGVLCDAWAERDHRIHVIHQQNQGLSGARNAGIEWALDNTESEWITFVDSDDWIHPRYLEVLYHAVQETDLRVAVGGFQRTSQDGFIPDLPEAMPPAVWTSESFYCDEKLTATVATGKLYSQKDFEDIRYPLGKIHEDEFTTYKLLFRYEKIAVVQQPLYLYFQNQEGIMRSGWSPKHIAESDGKLEQLLFLTEKGYGAATKSAALDYLVSVCNNLTSAEQQKGKYPAEEKRLRERLRKELRRYKRASGIHVYSAPWLYTNAYPAAAQLIRIWSRCHQQKKQEEK